MREIKFRGKSIDTDEWVYGNYDTSIEDGDNGGIEVYYEETNTLLTYINSQLVYPETVGQYTGLKDKNGVEVYEGDILQLFYGKENTPLTTTKVYFNEEGYWDSKNLSEQHPFRACYGGFSKCEIIGNIHDNPELLKEGE